MDFSLKILPSKKQQQKMMTVTTTTKHKSLIHNSLAPASYSRGSRNISSIHLTSLKSATFYSEVPPWLGGRSDATCNKTLYKQKETCPAANKIGLIFSPAVLCDPWGEAKETIFFAQPKTYYNLLVGGFRVSAPMLGRLFLKRFFFLFGTKLTVST